MLRHVRRVISRNRMLPLRWVLGTVKHGLMMSEGLPVNLVDLPEVLVNSTTRKNK